MHDKEEEEEEEKEKEEEEEEEEEEKEELLFAEVLSFRMRDFKLKRGGE
jgi:hypothetical protein